MTCSDLTHFEEQHFAERGLAMLNAHRPAVQALASALIENGRIEGDRVERIIDRGMGRH